ncbi:DUF5668 domain-containing protein [Bacteroidales bacterium OttesenSCG-928-L14]|nr:DUF5668 domain-containing protein [Bacteroidales bacterium OttesenSCG-928-L14]
MKKQNEAIKPEEFNKRMKRRHKLDAVLFALICIAIGVIFLGRNIGFISPQIFHTLISWQMLLVVLGIYSISHRAYLWGLLVSGTGLFFMIPLICGVENGWISAYWPLVLVFVGVLMVVKILLPKKKNDCEFNNKTEYHTEDGFVFSNNHFGSTQHVVMDEVFKGAEINNKFGATILDLRRTSLLPGNTYIDIDSRFGGIEIYVPNGCLILTEINTSMGGVSDERPNPIININEECKLILRGRLSASGVVIKS